jgi:hypothetical protein
MSAIKRITPEIEARLEEVAKLKIQTPSFAKLARETGLTESYLRQVVSKKIRVIANNRAVSCETNCD